MDYTSAATAKQAYADSPEVAPTFMNPLQNAAGGSRELMLRLEALANRLVGIMPASGIAGGAAGSNKLSPVPGSVFDQIDDIGRQINGDLNGAFEAINRIERALP